MEGRREREGLGKEGGREREGEEGREEGWEEEDKQKHLFFLSGSGKQCDQ